MFQNICETFGVKIERNTEKFVERIKHGTGHASATVLLCTACVLSAAEYFHPDSNVQISKEKT